MIGSFRNVLRGCSRIYSGQKTVYDAAQKGQQSSYHCATRSHLSYRSVFWHYALNKPSPYYCASKILQQSPYHCVPRNPLPQCAVYSHDTFNPALTNFWTNNARLYSTNKDSSNDNVDESKLSLYQKFKLMYKRYWYVLVPVHCATSVVWYGSFYIAAKNGVDVVPVLQSVGVTNETLLAHLSDSNAGYYAIAYALYKVATPARYTVTLGCTTVAINYLKNRGHIRPVPSPQQLKVLYEGKKEEMKERFEDTKGEVQERIDGARTVVNRNIVRGRRKMKARQAAMRARLQKHGLYDRLDDTKKELNKFVSGGYRQKMDTFTSNAKHEMCSKISNIKTRVRDAEQTSANSLKRTVSRAKAKIMDSYEKQSPKKK